MGIMTADLSVNLNGLKLNNPIITASGTFGYANEFDDFINVRNLGAIVTKAITLAPRPGNTGRRIMETPSGMINSIGLENMGVESFTTNVLPFLEKEKIPFIVNIAGASMDEYLKLAEICEANKIKAIEINLSCPNVKAGCMEFGVSEAHLYALIKEVRASYSGTIIAKLTPNITSIEKIALAAQNAGADAVSAINTLKATAINLNYVNGKFKMERVNGGLSGRAIKPVALRAISNIREVVDIPIIGMGGISSLSDILEFVAVGADAVQIGTANFTHPAISEELVNELSEFISTNGFGSFEELKRKLRKDIKE